MWWERSHTSMTAVGIPDTCVHWNWTISWSSLLSRPLSVTMSWGCTTLSCPAIALGEWSFLSAQHKKVNSKNDNTGNYSSENRLLWSTFKQVATGMRYACVSVLFLSNSPGRSGGILNYRNCVSSTLTSWAAQDTNTAKHLKQIIALIPQPRPFSKEHF